MGGGFLLVRTTTHEEEEEEENLSHNVGNQQGFVLVKLQLESIIKSRDQKRNEMIFGVIELLRSRAEILLCKLWMFSSLLFFL